MTEEVPRCKIYLSPRDRERFGVVAARADRVTEKDLGEVINFCQDHRIEFLIARCATSEIRSAQALEKAGFLLADTLIHYVRNMIKFPIPPPPGGISIRPFEKGEEKRVKILAADAFRRYAGHYQADKRLSHVPSEEIYSSWAVNSCQNRDHTQDVLLAEYGGDIVGFMTIRLNNPREGEGPLAGVASSAGKRSLVLRALSIGAMNWLKSRGATRCVASLSITNRVMQKLMSRLDFEPDESYYTFHKWFKRG